MSRHGVPAINCSIAPIVRLRSRSSLVKNSSRAVLGASILIVIGAVAAVVYAAPSFRAQFTANQVCCQIPFVRNVVVTANELLGRATQPSQVGQDKWVLETMFPDVTDGYFLDVGSAVGELHSNTALLERRSWKGI